MRKATILMLVFTMLTMMAPLATANYLIYNGSKTKDAYVIYTYWNEDRRESPPSGAYRSMVMPDPGLHVQGYYKVEPGNFRDLSLPKYVDILLYVRITVDNKPLVPDRDDTLSYSFNAHPYKAFSLWQSIDGKRIWNISKEVNRSELVNTSGFYNYQNGGLFNIGGPLKYGVKMLDFHVEGNKIWGGSWRYWKKTFHLPGKVLFIRVVKGSSYGRGGAEFDNVSKDGRKVIADGRIEDGGNIRGKLHIKLRVYYRK